MRWWLLLAAAGCGRLGFSATGADGGGPIDDARRDDGSPSTDGPSDATGSSDAPNFVEPCPSAAPIDDPIVWSVLLARPGASTGSPNVSLTAARTLGGAPFASMTTGGGGTGTLSMPTGGAPLLPWLTISGGGMVTATEWPTRAFRVSESLSFVVGTPADLAAMYAAKGLTEDPNKGTVAVSVIDCSFTSYDQVTLTSAPATTVVYFGTTAIPDGNLAATSTAGYAAFLDVPYGDVVLSGTRAGVAFGPITVAVSAARRIVALSLYPQ